MNSDHKDQQASLRKPWGSSEGMFLWSYPIYYFLSRVYDSWTGFDLFGKRIFRSSKYFSSPPDKKKSHKRNVHVWNQVHFFRLRSHEKLKFPSEKKIGRKKKNLGGNIIFIFYFFVNFFLLTFTRKKHKNAMCESDWGKKKKSQNNNKNTFSPRVKLKKISGEKKLFFSVWKKSPDSK